MRLLLSAPAALVVVVAVAVTATPACVWTAERRELIKNLSTTRSKAQFKVVIASLLVDGRKRRRAEYFAASSGDAAGIMNAFVNQGNATEDERRRLRARRIEGRQWQVQARGVAKKKRASRFGQVRRQQRQAYAGGAPRRQQGL